MIEIKNLGQLILSHAEMGAGSIAKYLKKNYPEKEAYLGIDKRYNELVLYSNNVNCKNLAVKFNGGGHKNRAGFKYDNILHKTGVKKYFLEVLISEINNNLL